MKTKIFFLELNIFLMEIKMNHIKYIANTLPKTEDEQRSVMSLQKVTMARKFHQSFPQYAPTPMHDLNGMAKEFGLAKMLVKDESYRFGLNAFKVLGGSFAMASYIAQKTNKDLSKVDYAYLTSSRLKAEFGQATFFTATDGNHGRGVAWAANKLGQKAVVLMPKGSSKSRFDHIAKEGATVTIEQVNYDECVRRANTLAQQTENGVMVQDTAWEGYEQIPAWIMQGYGTLAEESADQIEKAGIAPPTHIFVQAGVGSLAGAVAGYFVNRYLENPPKLIIMEAQAADCLYKSAKACDGEIRIATGDLKTIMAGLACGEPNTIGFDILKNHASFFVSCPDWVSAKGMRMLGAPVKGDPQIISGESGAVGMGLVATLMTDNTCAPMRDAMGLKSDSRVLIFSTEGDTDRDTYRAIVWGGKAV